MPRPPLPVWWKFENGSLVVFANGRDDRKLPEPGDQFDMTVSEPGYDNALLQLGFELVGNTIQEKSSKMRTAHIKNPDKKD